MHIKLSFFTFVFRNLPTTRKGSKKMIKNIMTHREFEELTKVKVSDETYTNTIEPAYMLDDMDKQIFCSEFKEHGFEFVALRAIRAYKEKQSQCDSLRHELKGLAEQCTRLADDDDADMARELVMRDAEDILGKAGFAKAMIANNINLSCRTNIQDYVMDLLQRKGGEQ